MADQRRLLLKHLWDNHRGVSNESLNDFFAKNNFQESPTKNIISSLIDEKIITMADNWRQLGNSDASGFKGKFESIILDPHLTAEGTNICKTMFPESDNIAVSQKMKKTIPIKLLEIVEAFMREYSECVTATSDDTSFYHIMDNDKRSNFFFKILRKAPPNVQFNTPPDIFYEKCPASTAVTNSVVSATSYAGLPDALIQWGNIIRKYNNIESVLEDPILKTYQKEFYDEFKIIDDDANISPFNMSQLIFLDKYLSGIKQGIEKYKNDSNFMMINEIILDTENLRQELTSISKNKVMKKLTTIWAKIQKQGLALAKEFVSEIKKDFFKMIIKGAKDIISNGGIDLLN